jgi:DNA-binding transcriptional ArsR family regulator
MFICAVSRRAQLRWAPHDGPASPMRAIMTRAWLAAGLSRARRSSVLVAASPPNAPAPAGAGDAPPMDEPAISELDQQWIKALGHPTRVAIIQRLLKDGEASPRELAVTLGQPLGRLSYHVRYLDEAGQITLTRRVQRRGAIEHRYRLTNPRVSSDALARLGLPTRDGTPIVPAPLGAEWRILRHALADLRRRREAQGIRREALARRLGIKTSYLASVERGEADLQYTVLAELARELGTTLGEVFTRAEAAVHTRHVAEPD